MKKKLLFMVINMNVGGTEKALLNMISEMPKKEYEITILMLEKYGGFLDSIPEGVTVEYIEGYNLLKNLLNNPPRQIIMDHLRKGKLLKTLTYGAIFLLAKFFGERTLYFKYLLRKTPVLEKDYDVAVAYAGPMDFISYFVVNKIKAKKKLQWIHFDVSKIGFNRKFAKKTYRNFDSICTVSEEARKKIISAIPTYENKIHTILNLVSPKSILDQSKKEGGFSDKEFTGLRILTVGRLAPEKGQDIAILVLERLIRSGYNVKWYCLGEGKYKEKYEKLLSKLNLKDNFIFLGLDTNPYTYINQCDIYVQPSRYEGYCITVTEAKILRKPIITTDVNGAREQIIDGYNGLVVDIQENEVYEAVKKLIIDQSLRGKFTKALSDLDVNHTTNISKILNISSF
ncbi:glycosyltransferase [Guptibacillus spartinae]|uniref:glycosyltransferase n=1 Tax=Guptibacillus spartinae TaxID=3025679 RepID=UPI0023611A62|nr:glycosyltransferase [Pseudalkalibacillus spartinae]